MNLKLKDEEFNRKSVKKHGFRRFYNSFGYSFDGLKYAYKYEQSMAIHILIAVIVVIVGVLVKLNLIEWLFCFVLMGLVMATELINTSIEAVVDLTCPQIHPLAKIAKDTASAAVLVFSSVAFIGGMVIFIPNIIEFIAKL